MGVGLRVLAAAHASCRPRSCARAASTGCGSAPVPGGSKVLVKGDGVRAGCGRQARHDARLLVVAHPLLEEVGLAPAAGPNVLFQSAFCYCRRVCYFLKGGH